jgi:hypothetical protein
MSENNNTLTLTPAPSAEDAVALFDALPAAERERFLARLEGHPSLPDSWAVMPLQVHALALSALEAGHTREVLLLRWLSEAHGRERAWDRMLLDRDERLARFSAGPGAAPAERN